MDCRTNFVQKIFVTIPYFGQIWHHAIIQMKIKNEWKITVWLLFQNYIIPQVPFILGPMEQIKTKSLSGNWSAKDHPQLIHRIKICALEINIDVITKMSQNLKAKIHKGKENGLTSLLWYVTYPKSIDYEIILTMIVSNSLEFELVQFFLDQTLLN